MQEQINNQRKVRFTPPAILTGLVTHEIKGMAAGIPAVTVSLQHIAHEMGLWKGLKALSKLNQRDGFDCPGCAWPEPEHRSKLGEYCENGAKAVAEEATNFKCDPAFFAKHSVEEMSEWSDYEIGKSGRVTEPMYLPKGESYYKPIDWQSAFNIIKGELKQCASPNDAVFYTSGRTSNEAAFLYQLFVRAFGTNNLPDCSNMCHESSGVGLGETIGIGKGTVTLQDIYDAEVVLVIGQNPGTNHPRMLSALQKCKKNGGMVIHINPLPEVGTTKFSNPQSPLDILTGGTKIADHFLQVKIGGDIALLKLLMQYLMDIEETRGNVFDKNFIASQTENYDAMIAELKSFDVVKAYDDCGISNEQIETVGKILCERKNIISCWAMGLTQHKHAVNNIREIVNLHLLLGAVGKPGAGLCPVRGHSNVQGDRTMGIYEKPKPEFLDGLDRAFDMKSPRADGYDTVECIEAMHENKVKVFMAMGGNFVSATPDSEFTGRAIQNVKLTVQISTKLNRSHLVTGEHALILPCLGRSELDIQNGNAQFVSVENSMGVVSSSRGNLEPASTNLKSEPAIVAELAAMVLGPKNPIDWRATIADYDITRNHIEAAIVGFDNYNKRVRQPDGFYLPNGPRTGKFSTENGKAKFTVNPLPNVEVKDGHLIMMTIRSHDQYNTTIYGLNDRYRGIKNERRVVLLHPADMQKLNIKEKEIVNLVGEFNGVKRIAEKFHALPFNIPLGCAATYFPETNCLVPIDSYADKSKTPVSKFIEIRIEKCE